MNTTSNNKENKISALVIGSKDHTLAEHCADWGDDDFYIGDYDLVVINMKSLNNETFQKLSSVKYFHNLRDKIVEAQTEKGISVFCIMSEMKLSDIKGHNLNRNITNYDWSPVIPILEEQNGQKIKEVSLTGAYPSLVKGWSRLLDTYYDNTNIKEIENRRRFRIYISNLMKNEANRALAFSFYWYFDRGYNNSSRLIDSNTEITFLPEIENVRDGIDLILKEQMEIVEDPAPDYIDEIHVSGEKDVLADIENLEQKIQELKDTRIEKETELEKISKFKKLLYLKGVPLEKIVEESLRYLGIELYSPNVTNEEDRYFKTKDGAKIYFEIRGKNNSGMNANDLNQLTSRLTNEHKDEDFKTQGVFVLNHYKDTKPEDRSNPFDHNIIEKAKPWKIALVTTYELFKLIQRKMKGQEINRLEKELFNTIGVFEAKITEQENGGT